MAYNMDKMPQIKRWFYQNFIKRNWEDIQHKVYDLWEEETGYDEWEDE